MAHHTIFMISIKNVNVSMTCADSLIDTAEIIQKKNWCLRKQWTKKRADAQEWTLILDIRWRRIDYLFSLALMTSDVLGVPRNGEINRSLSRINHVRNDLELDVIDVNRIFCWIYLCKSLRQEKKKKKNNLSIFWSVLLSAGMSTR